jgi:prophage regulatory protein
MADTFLSDNQIAIRYGVHRATIWRWANMDPDFPKPVKLSAQCTRWKLSQIEAWEAHRASHT